MEREALEMGPFDSRPMGSFISSSLTYGLSRTVVELSSLLQKRLRKSARLPVRTGYDEKYRFVERVANMRVYLAFLPSNCGTLLTHTCSSKYGASQFGEFIVQAGCKQMENVS